MASLPAGFFYPSVWDPPLIMLQILAMQCLFYLAVGVGLVFYGLLLGQGFFLYEQVFSAGLLHFSSPLGWSTVLSFLSAALARFVPLSPALLAKTHTPIKSIDPDRFLSACWFTTLFLQCGSAHVGCGTGQKVSGFR
ncbi:Integral membrane protein of the Golgi [Balamuthia mandrillaris]